MYFDCFDDHHGFANDQNIKFFQHEQVILDNFYILYFMQQSVWNINWPLESKCVDDSIEHCKLVGVIERKSGDVSLCVLYVFDMTDKKYIQDMNIH